MGLTFEESDLKILWHVLVYFEKNNPHADNTRLIKLKLEIEGKLEN